MTKSIRNKRKIINDPVYGFIPIQNKLLFELIEHPYFQRLRRIKQLGLTHLVYPGALHTRFHHSVGATYLMSRALSTLKDKGHSITEEETTGALIAILLHDIGHGPYSHALEHSLVNGVTHEDISEAFMQILNQQFNNELKIGIDIFRNTYSKHFLHQLVSSQLDMDRMDYLKRDTFFTGVSEGIINTDRIIKMLDVVNDELVVEAKGIYSIEKFIIARRLMYWQVYLHKTVLAAEYMLMKILKRAKELKQSNSDLFATSALSFFLIHEYEKDDFKHKDGILEHFSHLDDYDIFTSLKEWTGSQDKVLSFLCKGLVDRKLFRIEIQNSAFSEDYIQAIRNKTKKHFGLSEAEIDYLVISDTTSNYAYNPKVGEINILYKNGSIEDIATASDQLNISVLSQAVTKHFICYPKNI